MFLKKSGSGWRWAVWACLSAFGAFANVGCSSSGAGAFLEERTRAGVLRVGLTSELNGVGYRLAGSFDVVGPETLEVESETTQDSLSLELIAGSYTVSIEPGFRIFADAQGVQTLVPAELLSPVEQAVEVVANEATQVAYRFRVPNGLLALEPGALDIALEIARATDPCQTPLSFQASAPLAVGNQPGWVGHADFDGDGLVDLVSSSQFSTDVSVMYGAGQGEFEPAFDYPAASAELVYQGALADFDRDGRTDVVLANSRGVSLISNGGARSFGTPRQLSVAGASEAVAVGDVSGDGWLDIIFTLPPDRIGVLLNRGSGTFGIPSIYVSGAGPGALAVGDIDGDLQSDIAVANRGEGSVSVLLNRGDGSFHAASTLGVGGSPISLALEDLNADGLRDLVAANSPGGASVLLNQGQGQFAAPVAYPLESLSPSWLTVADLNLDGAPDLVVAMTDTGLGIFFNRGNGELDAAIQYPLEPGAAAVMAADLNADGGVDLAVAHYNALGAPQPGSLRVLLNACLAE